MNDPFRLDQYDYELPPELIAQHPLDDRSSSRLMVMDRISGRIRHCFFHQIVDFLEPDDCLVLNDSKVFPARIKGKKPTGGRIELFLLHFPKESVPGKAKARALYRSSKPPRENIRIICSGSLEITVDEVLPGGQAEVTLTYFGDLHTVLRGSGTVPLPPYIRRNQEPEDVDRYQTTYASRIGSVAAPTAGLHFTEKLLRDAERKGITLARITLHVGYGTFAPVRSSDIRRHTIHAEWASVPESAVEAVNRARRNGGRIVAVGTTTVRSLETSANASGAVRPYEGECDLYIIPGYSFRAVDNIITNFHLPRSSLLLLVSAFAGKNRILSAYRQAAASGYRFYSYGDAMLIT